MPNGEPNDCMKFTNLHKKSRQILRQQICHKALFASIQSDPDPNQEWLGRIGAKWGDKFGITNFTSALGGWATSFDFRSCQWSYNHLWSRNMWWIQHQQTTKCLRVEWNVTHIMRVRELYWQFCWYLVHSKPTTHRHYRLLRTRTSHRQLKLISRQCKINWIRLWTRSWRQPFSELNCLKLNIWLMHPWSKCSGLTQVQGKNMLLVVPCFGRSR